MIVAPDIFHVVRIPMNGIEGAWIKSGLCDDPEVPECLPQETGGGR